jgi:hypothetical protein
MAVLRSALCHFLVSGLGRGHIEHVISAALLRYPLGESALAAAHTAQNQDQPPHTVSSLPS